MLLRSIFLTILPGIAAGGSSASYTLEPLAFDHGGLLGSSGNYNTSSSSSPGGAGSSGSYAVRTGFAGQLAESLPTVVFTAPASLAADGSGKVFVAAADGTTVNSAYSGRGSTIYSSLPAAPSAVGLYLVTATGGPDYLGSGSLDFVIHGPLAASDSLTKPANHAPITIPVSDLLGNDTRMLPDGSISSAGLSITAVEPGPGNNIYLGTGDDAGWLFFIPSNAPSESFTYSVSDGSSTATAIATVSALGFTPTFVLQMTKRGTADFDGIKTSSTFDFIAVPGQVYQIEYSSDLVEWIPAEPVSSGPSGSFSLVLSRSGNFAAAWNRSLFFRAKL